MSDIEEKIDPVRSSRAGHTFHERWAARRALQLVFPHDGLYAIAVEGLSSTETAKPGDEAEDVADLVLYFGTGDNFVSCDRLETVQFKYKDRAVPVTASYLKKTIEKFCDSIVGYEAEASAETVDTKVSFAFVTNADFSEGLWAAIKALKAGEVPESGTGAEEVKYLTALCKAHKVNDPKRLFARTEFRAAEKSLPAQTNLLRRTLTDWSAGADGTARLRLHGMQELVLRKAGPGGQRNNLIRREDVLDALECDPDDLFPADTRFIDVGDVVERTQLGAVSDLLGSSQTPVFVHAEGGVGKTVFIQSLAARLNDTFEVVVFDCFGGGAYRSDDQARHLPKIGLIQIANELAARGLCDPLLPGDSDRIGLIKAARKRFTQAAGAIRAQSDKNGVLIVIDAADNAQVEADHRHEDAFPKLLLSSLDGTPIDGVKLLLTARSHRMADVVAKSTVAPFELGPFTEAEAKEFLRKRRDDLPDVELATALARSGRNARVLDYLVQTWDLNVVGRESSKPITVPEIIAQRCEKIFADLETAGWKREEIREFFAALSLLPTPIPLDELATALNWSMSQVSTAASDLAPMLELETHGAIFRDEPTETYIRETYARETVAQQAIAGRLQSAQATSAYAAEALPHFLVVINNSDRAFALADSLDFPKTIQSDFGRRRLTLARLRAAFRLAVSASDFDRVLNLTARLAQVAAANRRGDEFIRRSPALAIMLGDPDAYRRLFNDRTGWRGAKHARLAIAHSFAGALDEAYIQRESTIRWMRWNSEQHREGQRRKQDGPDIDDFAAVLFQSILQGEYEVADRNLVRWGLSFSLSTAGQVLQLLKQYLRFTGNDALRQLIAFSGSAASKSYALKIALLSRDAGLSKSQVKAIARSAGELARFQEQEVSAPRYERSAPEQSDIVRAAFTALIYGSRTAAKRILASSAAVRPSSHDYTERHGPSWAWGPTFRACVGAWVQGRRVTFHDLLPMEVKVTNQSKAITDEKGLLALLKELRAPRLPHHPRRRGKQAQEPQFDSREQGEIVAGINLVLSLVRPIEDAILATEKFDNTHLESYLGAWQSHLRTDIYPGQDRPLDILSRTIGLGFVRVILRHGEDVEQSEAVRLVGLVSTERFTVSQKSAVLSHLARRPKLHSIAGNFARHVAEQILKDDYVEQRGQSYAALSVALLDMSVEEAREYYRQGLAELDQMGGEDFEQIHALMHFAATQKGGVVRPELGQRTMNLCQTIMQGEPSKFWWLLFAQAAANSVGAPAGYKLLRWDDQDVVNFSYGLPQFACLMAQKRTLDPRWAAFLLLICEDHIWHEWQVGDGLMDLLDAAQADDRPTIFRTVVNKLRAEHDSGGWPSIWRSLLKIRDRYPDVVSDEDRDSLAQLRLGAERRRDAENARGESDSLWPAETVSDTPETDAQKLVAELVRGCDPASPSAIDHALGRIDEDQSLPYHTRKDFFDGIRAACPYDKQLSFLLALCEAGKLDFDRVLDLLIECVDAWGGSSVHLTANTKRLVQLLFDFKGSGLFDDQYSRVTRHIARLSDFCGDRRFVLECVLRTISLEQIELDGDEWLQLATSLCTETSPAADLASLETLLSGRSARIADQIGEGPYRPDLKGADDGTGLLTDMIWHLLGDDDAYVRWSVARAISALADLGLEQAFELLLDHFDRTSVAALVSSNRMLPFQNSQQWLLMGLARATLRHGPKLGHLRERLLALAQRSDLHVVMKVFICRCLENLGDKAKPDANLDALRASIATPTHGYEEKKGWPAPVERGTKFRFDYEFDKSEIGALARLFGLAKETVSEAIAAEITKKWPQATDLSYFPGGDRYRRDSEDRYEFFREHVQRHALLSVATSLVATLPVAKHSSDDPDYSPWREWLSGYDVTFDDGSLLADHKDPMPSPAKASVLGPTIKRQEILKDQQTLLDALQLTRTDAPTVLLYASWTSPDGVEVSVVSGLSDRKGAIGRCAELSKRTGYDLWLPQFWDDGHFDPRSDDPVSFDPFIWAPPHYGLGIDTGDEIAAQGPAHRPRLGKTFTSELALTPSAFSEEWRDTSGSRVLWSDAWGKWQPTPDDHRSQYHNDGKMLRASAEWLDKTLARLGKRLVYTINFSKYGSTRSHQETSGAKAIYVGLRTEDPLLRVWHAKQASKRD